MLRQHDELRELADEMNQMCERLAESRTRIAAETEARAAAVEQMRHSERLATVGRLAAGIAHEMGTPLNIVLARASVIHRVKSLDEAAAQALVIERQVGRMSQIIRGLLDFARRSPLRRRTVDPLRVARATAQMLQPMADKEGISIAVAEEDACAPGGVLTGDEAQLQQVLTNLVVNAIQAGHEGGQVRISCRSVDGAADNTGPGGESLAGPAVVISVADDGDGMAEEVRNRVFEPFFTTKDVGQGSGLGLAVSHGIVHEHGGFIDVTSAPGQGACFSVYLPPPPPPSATPPPSPSRPG